MSGVFFVSNNLLKYVNYDYKFKESCINKGFWRGR